MKKTQYPKAMKTMGMAQDTNMGKAVRAVKKKYSSKKKAC